MREERGGGMGVGVGVKGEETEKGGGGKKREIGSGGGGGDGKGDTVFFNISSLSPLPCRLPFPISPQLVQCIPSSHALSFFLPVQDFSYSEALQVHGSSRIVLSYDCYHI